MGIYIFNKELLKKALTEDSVVEDSDHDFGKNIIPNLLADGSRLFCYEFSGFWKDVGTIPSYHETSMGLLDENPEFDLTAKDFPIMSNSNISPPLYTGDNASIEESLMANGSTVLGTVRHSIIGTDCYIGEGAYVEDSVLLPGAQVRANARVIRAILGENAVIEKNAVFGSADPNVDIAVAGNDFVIDEGGAN